MITQPNMGNVFCLQRRGNLQYFIILQEGWEAYRKIMDFY